MKFSKIILSLLFVISTHILYSQTGVNRYALVSITTSPYAEYSCIIITYEDGKQKKIDLPRREPSSKKELFWSSKKEIDALIVKTLNEMAENGYKIITVNSPFQENTVYTMENFN